MWWILVVFVIPVFSPCPSTLMPFLLIDRRGIVLAGLSPIFERWIPSNSSNCPGVKPLSQESGSQTDFSLHFSDNWLAPVLSKSQTGLPLFTNISYQHQVLRLCSGDPKLATAGGGNHVKRGLGVLTSFLTVIHPGRTESWKIRTCFKDVEPSNWSH